VVAAALCSCGAADAPSVAAPLLVPVRAKKPSVRELPVRLEYPAEIAPIQTADIKSIEARGFIRKILVDKGDRVKKGQVLVTVDCPDYRNRSRQASEEIRSVRAVFGNAKRVYERLKPMLAGQYISQTELDNAEAVFLGAQARLRTAEARRSEVNEVLGYCTMAAPFDGEVSARLRDPGAQVRPGGSPILTLMRIDTVRVWVNVVERDATHVKLGLPATLRVHGVPGKRFEGVVTRFVQGFDRRTRTLLTEVELKNPEGLLKPGMFGRLSIVVETKPNAVLVPQSAVLTQECATAERSRCSWVYVVENGHTRRVEVSVGYESGDEIEIRKGVAANDLVVYAGRDLVADGTPVKLQP